MNFKKVLCLSVCISFVAVIATGSVSAQQRERVVRSTSSQPTNLPQVPVQQTQPRSLSRPTLTNQIIVVPSAANTKPLVKRIVSSRATNAGATAITSNRTVYGASTSSRIDQAIKARYGIRYVYGTSGPNSYDCSGFVWAAFQEAGINFTRQSARSLWSQSTPVEGDDRFKYGTLVFLNGLGHMGIVADENGFYHASSSKGITYSRFKGYWANRIVGFRTLNAESTTPSVDRDER